MNEYVQAAITALNVGIFVQLSVLQWRVASMQKDLRGKVDAEHHQAAMQTLWQSHDNLRVDLNSLIVERLK